MGMRSGYGVNAALVFVLLFGTAWVGCGEEEDSNASASTTTEAADSATKGAPEKGPQASKASAVSKSTVKKKAARHKPKSTLRNKIGAVIKAETTEKPSSRPFCTLRLTGPDDKVFDMERMPCSAPGTKTRISLASNDLESLTVNGKKVAVSGKSASWEVDFARRTLKMPIKDIESALAQWKDELVLVDGGKTYKGTLKCGVCKELIKGLCGKGPFKATSFGSRDKPGDVLTALLCTPDHKIQVAIGSTKPKLWHIDYVIRAVPKDRKLSSCRYKGKGGARLKLTRTAQDAHLKLYDRRTGQFLQKKRVKASSPVCPSYVPSNYGNLFNNTSSSKRKKTAWKLLRARKSKLWQEMALNGKRPSAPRDASWKTSAVMYKKAVGLVVSYKCPPNGKLGRSVWGTDRYTLDSGVCVAAVHAGKITLKDGGLVVLTIGGSHPKFQSTVRHGVKTQKWGRYRWTYTFLDDTGSK